MTLSIRCDKCEIKPHFLEGSIKICIELKMTDSQIKRLFYEIWEKCGTDQLNEWIKEDSEGLQIVKV